MIEGENSFRSKVTRLKTPWHNGPLQPEDNPILFGNEDIPKKVTRFCPRLADKLLRDYLR